MNDGNDETWTQSLLVLKQKPECVGHTSQQIRWIDSEVLICAYYAWFFYYWWKTIFLCMEVQDFTSETISSKCNYSRPSGFKAQICRVGH